MNLQQLRYLCAVVDNGLNVSDAAEALVYVAARHQQADPAARRRARPARLRAAGQAAGVADARRRSGRRNRAARAAGDREPEARRRRVQERGCRRSGASRPRIRRHATCCRRCCREFAARFPKVRLVLHQGNPLQVAEQTLSGDVDVGIATEAARRLTASSSPCPAIAGTGACSCQKDIRWPRCDRSRWKRSPSYPIVTYDFAFTGRSEINAAFAAQAGSSPTSCLPRSTPT